tara:strand:+ start:937 stop:1095 length:159 start_codon:yes stop_codon:yes gene_type:complete
MAIFQIDTPFLKEIKKLIEQEENIVLKTKFKPIHYADLAEIIESLSIDTPPI